MKIINGNCLDIMKTMEDNSVDSIVTDPPYGLVSIVKRFGKKGSAPAKFGTDGAFQRSSKGFMGKEWDGSGIEQSVEMWSEALRVLKPGGYLLAFGGTRTCHRMTCAIEDAGFEIRDLIMWCYGSGFPKSHNIGKALQKQGVDSEYYNKLGTALKPALEPITVARKPLSEKTVASNVLKWGTGGINIDGCRVEFGNETDGRVGTDTLAKGSKESIFGGYSNIKDKNIQMYKGNGRFPANLIHDGSDEVVGLFPDTKTNSTGKNSPADYKTKSVFGAGYKSGAKPYSGNSGSASRFFYCAKSSKTDRNEGCEELEEKARPTMGSGIGGQPDQQKTNNRNNHPTVKPTKLMQYLVRLVTPKGGTCLDPFMGSGSTGKACVLENFNFVGIEMDKEYCKIAEVRIEWAKKEKEKENKTLDF